MIYFYCKALEKLIMGGDEKCTYNQNQQSTSCSSKFTSKLLKIDRINTIQNDYFPLMMSLLKNSGRVTIIQVT